MTTMSAAATRKTRVTQRVYYNAAMLRMAIGVAALLLGSGAARAQLTAEAPPALTAACDDLDLPSLIAAIERESAALARSPATLTVAGRPVRAADYAARTLQPILAWAKAGDLPHLCGALQYNYTWLRVGPGHVGFTAYHTPTVKGSLTRDATYRYPLYRRPAGALASLTTAQVLAGGLANCNLELVWLADPYDALALHVEGAGLVELPDGSRLPLGTDGHNGQPYQNVSKLLIADGRLAAGVPQQPSPHGQPGNPKARAFFATHPGELERYWGRNAHFVFFKRAAAAGSGQFGALVAGRSVAVDVERVPMGALLFVRAYRPVVTNGAVTGWAPLQRVMVAQDTGAGIRGQRMDLYFGEDAYAQVAAQTMSLQGDAWVLMSK
jgi:membrane-bound lytic murein transglycosylase A